jgi:hypothetical protein
MPNRHELTAYESGIRVSQANCLLNVADKVADSEVLNVLLRLEGAVSRIGGPERNDSSPALSRAIQIIGKAVGSWMDASNESAFDKRRTALAAQLLIATDLLASGFNDSGLAVAHWFQLGQAIADGADETWSEGTLRFSERTYDDSVPAEDRLLYPVLIATGGAPARWEWSDENRVRQLAESVSMSLDVLFRDREAQLDPDSSIFQQLPFSRYWGWHAVELGLQQLASGNLTPRWDAVSRTLSMGDRIIHRFRNPALNQEVMLAAFEAANWASHVDCPRELGASKPVRDTIDALNRNLSSAGLRITGGVRGLCWQCVGLQSD